MDKKIKIKIVNSLEKEEGYTNCENCGEKHKETTSNCCWVGCKCGEEICGKCGSTNIGRIDEDKLDLSNGSSDDNYWCCKECKDCGLRGCGMCI